VRIVSDATDRQETVENVYAVDADTEDAIKEIGQCDIMATAVGVNALPRIIGNIAGGIKMRMALNNGPLDIILAENQLDIGKIMRKMIYEKLDTDEQRWADNNLGLVEASIGRMVPPLTEEAQKDSPLLIAVEPYAELPVDSLGFKGPVPGLAGLKPFTPFSFYVKRKLFLHNMGHAACAYLGWKKRYEYISEAIRDTSIYETVRRAMESVVTALSKEYRRIPFVEIEANKDDLLERFRNRALKDTITRVANDPIRKLRSNDRLTGSALYCLDNGVCPGAIAEGIVAALEYDNPMDAEAMKMQAGIADKGLDYVLESIMGINRTSELAGLIRERI
jgi:mannitol-1-phosphate 5-dehydrogenase